MIHLRLGYYFLPILVVVLAGCATPESSAPGADGNAAERESHATRPSKPSSRRSDARLKAMPDRPLNVAAECNFRDPSGYEGRLRLDVQEAKVQRFEAEVAVPKYGNCRFDLKNFEQTGVQPVTLKNRQGDCAIHIWEQGNQVTVGFGECHSHCSGGARDYLWPILVNAGNGSCS
jgi:hypothetical protein